MMTRYEHNLNERVMVLVGSARGAGDGSKEVHCAIVYSCSFYLIKRFVLSQTFTFPYQHCE